MITPGDTRSLRTLTAILVSLVIGCSGKKSTVTPTFESVPVFPQRPLTAAFIVTEGMNYSDIKAPMEILRATAGQTEVPIEVFTVSLSAAPLLTTDGTRIRPDFSFDDPRLPFIDILVVADVTGPTAAQTDTLVNFVKRTGRQASYYLSLGDGIIILARAGLLNAHYVVELPVTGRLREEFPQVRIKPGVSFVHDRKSITSMGGDRSGQPVFYLVDLLYGRTVATEIDSVVEDEWNPLKIKYLRVN